ncbi:MAG: hypothetical protein Alis3KO_35870 [Aliiglaciecola sp.]
MQQRGFTLIELIIVIVILGILAVTAAPRFIDLSSDANRSVLRGVQAAVQSGAQLVYARSAIAGQQGLPNANNATTQVNVGGQDVNTNYGYPDADAASATNVTGWLQIDIDILAADPADSDFVFVAGSGAAEAGSPAAGSFAIHPRGTAVDFSAAETGKCYVLYTEAAENGSPAVDVEDEDC